MKNIGLKRGDLAIMDYQNDYPAIYKKEKANLLKIYKNKINRIEHVGSTSIKDIKSKPIIDIMIETDDLDDFIKYTQTKVAGEVYTFREEQTDGDFLVRKEEDGKVKAFIHVYQTGDENASNLVLFRDYLNNNEKERIKYESLKEKLLVKYKDERSKYTLGKDKYIKSIIKKAKKENSTNS